MKITKTLLSDCFIIDPTIHGDEEDFLETFQKERYGNFLGNDLEFVQDNHSRSSSGSFLRLHFKNLSLKES